MGEARDLAISNYVISNHLNFEGTGVGVSMLIWDPAGEVGGTFKLGGFGIKIIRDWASGGSVVKRNLLTVQEMDHDLGWGEIPLEKWQPSILNNHRQKAP